MTRPCVPDPIECATLLLRLLEMRNSESPTITRARLSERTLRSLWGRDRITPELIGEVEPWMWRGGWSLFYAQSTYAVIQTSSVLSWARLTSKPMAGDFEQISAGTFDYECHFHLFDSWHSDDE